MSNHQNLAIQEVGEATVRAGKLALRMGAAEVARRMQPEFHLCVYAVKRTVYGHYLQGDYPKVVVLVKAVTP